MSQAEFWIQNPPLPPRSNTFNGEQCDPFELVKNGIKKEEQLDWLNDELVKLIEQHAPKESDIDVSTGKVDIVALQNSGQSLIKARRTFANFYQLKQFARKWSAAWGIHLSTWGLELRCFFAERTHRQENRFPDLSPSKRRKRTSMKTGCKFKIRCALKITDTEEKLPRYLIPVRITSCCLEHTCEPSLQSLRIAKKAAGEYSLDLNELGNVVNYFLLGTVTTSQGRQLLKPFWPEGVDISACDIQNFRARAIKFDLEGGLRPTAEEAKSLLSVKPLDENELVLEAQSDLTISKVREYLRQVLQDSGDGWKVSAFLEKISHENAYFDYRVWRDERTGAPLGVVWMTQTMKEKWIRFGSTLSLDAMKRQLNSLHWPYIAPVIFDHELRVCVVAESLIIEESHAAYEFVLQSIFDMEPNRDKSQVAIIFADCGVTNSLLGPLGIEKTCNVIWDSFHLLSKVWPEALGEHIFIKVSTLLRDMVYSKTEEDYKKAFQNVTCRLESKHPQALEYLNGFYIKPKTYAQHFVRTLPDNLGKSSSQGAEANHSSVVAHGSAGSKQDPVKKIENLLERQETLQTKHNQSDAKYYHLSKTHALQEQNPVLKQAYQVLSQTGMRYFKHIVNDAGSYTKMVLNDGSTSVYRRGARQTSERLLVQGQRCQCTQRLSFTSLCVHEFVAGDCTFQKHLFSDRLIQPGAAGTVTITQNIFHQKNAKFDENYTQYDRDDDDTDDDDDKHTPRKAKKHEETKSSDDESTDNIPLSQLVEEENESDDWLVTQDSTVTPKQIPRAKLVEVCNNLTAAAEVSPEMSVTVYSTLTSLLDLVRGGKSDNIIAISAMDIMARTRKMSRVEGQPVPGRMLTTGGRPGTKRKVSKIMEAHGGHVASAVARATTRRSCGFCKSNDHTAKNCISLLSLGKRVKKADIDDFRQRVLNERSSLIRMDSARVQELVGSSGAPMVQAIPQSTKWLVVHAIYNLSGTAAAGTFMLTRQQIELGVEVSCYNDFGQAVPTIRDQTEKYFHRMAKIQAVNDWIARKCGGSFGSGASHLIDDTSSLHY
jgi:hypothetical protein